MNKRMNGIGMTFGRPFAGVILLFLLMGQHASQAQKGEPAKPPLDNYHFLAIDRILFEDDFKKDRPGELPSRWNFQAGRGTVISIRETLAVSIDEGNYAKMVPQLKGKLPEAYAIEFDHFVTTGPKAYGPVLFLANAEGKEAVLSFSDIFFSYTFQSRNLIAPLPDDLTHRHFHNQWMHLAVASRNNQLLVFINQRLVCAVPNLNFRAATMKIGGIGNKQAPIQLTNVRISELYNASIVNRLNQDGKLVARDIQFEENKVALKPESLVRLKEVAKLMKEQGSLRFEIQYYTDEDGDAQTRLWESRAEAVRTLLASLGVRASRLTARSFGSSKPVEDNNTPEGKANNRRIEFIKN